MDMKLHYIFMIQLMDDPVDGKGVYNSPRNRHMYYIDSDSTDNAVQLFASRLLTDLDDYSPQDADHGNVKPLLVEWIDGICSHSAAFLFSDGTAEYPYEVEMYNACSSGNGRIYPLMWSHHMIEVANKEFTKSKYYYTLISKSSIAPLSKNCSIFARNDRDAITLIVTELSEETGSTFSVTYVAYGKYGTVAWIKSKDDVCVIIITKNRFTTKETTEMGD